MDDDVPSGWTTETCRSYTQANSDRQLQYRTYRHESDDLRVKVAPASLDGADHPGYALTATSYPGLDCSETIQVRRVLTFDRCDRIAARFMQLFSASYDGRLEEALEYTYQRTRDHR